MSRAEIGLAGADGILQVRNSGTSSVIAVGLFTNVHVSDGSSIVYGAAPGAANPRDQIVLDMSLDGNTAFISSNADGGNPEFIRNLTSTNAGSTLILAPNNASGTSVLYSNAPLGTVGKNMSFVGSLSPNVHVLNAISPAVGINLTSNTNLGSAFTLNGGTFETGAYQSTVGTTNLQPLATPGTSGTFLVNAGTFNANRSADATITYNGGTLNLNAPQNLAGFNVNTFFTANTNSLTIGSLTVSASATLDLSATTAIAATTLNNGTINFNPPVTNTVNLGVLSGGGSLSVAGSGAVATAIASGSSSGTVTLNFGAVIDVPATKTLTLTGAVAASDITKGPLGGTVYLNTPTPLGLNSLNANGGTVLIGAATSAPIPWGSNSEGFSPAPTITPGANIFTLNITNNATVAFATTVGSGNPYSSPFTGTLPTNRITHQIGSLVLPYATGGSANAFKGGGDGTGTITPAGTLDIGNHQVLLNTPSLSDVNNVQLLVAAGYNASNYGNEDGKWNGTGITSSIAKSSYVANAGVSKYAVGYAYGSDASVKAEQGGGADGTNGSLDGIGANQTLVRAVLLGDVNMDGVVDFADISSILGYHYNDGKPAHYTDGDISNHGIVNFDDISLVLAFNYNNNQVFPAQSAAQAQSKLTALQSAPAKTASASTLTGRGAAATAAATPAANSSIGTTGDGAPDFVYNPNTGDLTLILDGLNPVDNTGAQSFVTSVQLNSVSGLFITTPNGTVHTSGWSGKTLASTKIAGALTDDPGFANGVDTFSYDLGNILPKNMSAANLTSDLTVKYQVQNNGALTNADIVLTPEPTSLAFVGLGAMSILGRRRKRAAKI